MGTITGKVNRTYVSDKGTFGKLTIEASNGRRICKHDLKAFDADLIATIKALKTGQEVSVEYTLDTECQKDKAGQDVTIDGYKLWTTCLKPTSINGVVSSDDARPLNDTVPF